MNARRIRNARQRRAAEWAVNTFGQSALNMAERRLRFFEEATELCQSVGLTREMAHFLIDKVFDRPAGEPAQELGGAGVTLICLAESLGISADAAEKAEVARILSLPAAHFQQRHARKKGEGYSADLHSDPVYWRDGEWFFVAEDWATEYGPYPSEAVARQELDTYLDRLEGGPT